MVSSDRVMCVTRIKTDQAGEDFLREILSRQTLNPSMLNFYCIKLYYTDDCFLTFATHESVTLIYKQRHALWRAEVFMTFFWAVDGKFHMSCNKSVNHQGGDQVGETTFYQLMS